MQKEPNSEQNKESFKDITANQQGFRTPKKHPETYQKSQSKDFYSKPENVIKDSETTGVPVCQFPQFTSQLSPFISITTNNIEYHNENQKNLHDLYQNPYLFPSPIRFYQPSLELEDVCVPHGRTSNADQVLECPSNNEKQFKKQYYFNDATHQFQLERNVTSLILQSPRLEIQDTLYFDHNEDKPPFQSKRRLPFSSDEVACQKRLFPSSPSKLKEDSYEESYGEVPQEKMNIQYYQAIQRLRNQQRIHQQYSQNAFYLQSQQQGTGSKQQQMFNYPTQSQQRGYSDYRTPKHDKKLYITQNHSPTQRKMFPQSFESSAKTLTQQSQFQLQQTGTKKVSCNCKKSKCLKLYCECFQNGEFCQNCNCVDCDNIVANEHLREQAILQLRERNPNAFKNKITVPEEGEQSSQQKHSRGCNCKKSNCQKKYCECYQAGVKCGDLCKCASCQNKFDLGDGNQFDDQQLLNNESSPSVPLNQQEQYRTELHPQSHQKFNQESVFSNQNKILSGKRNRSCRSQFSNYNMNFNFNSNHPRKRYIDQLESSDEVNFEENLNKRRNHSVSNRIKRTTKK